MASSAEGLTPRQREIAQLVARGLSNKAIARQMGLAVETVKVHVRGAASRLPGDGPPRYKLIVFGLSDEGGLTI